LLKIFGTDYPTPDGTCIRDYIHIYDLADAHLKALEYVQKTGQVICLNLGSEHGYSVKEIIKMCEKVSGQKVITEESARRPGDPPVLVADSAQAKKILRWQPRYSLEDIIRTAWAWEKNRKY
jgi:UDP-glucose 4-epimerase